VIIEVIEKQLRSMDPGPHPLVRVIPPPAFFVVSVERLGELGRLLVRSSGGPATENRVMELVIPQNPDATGQVSKRAM
jgi:hypothetical protein